MSPSRGRRIHAISRSLITWCAGRGICSAALWDNHLRALPTQWAPRSFAARWKNGLALNLGFSLLRSSSNALIDNKSFELISKAASRDEVYQVIPKINLPRDRTSHPIDASISRSHSRNAMQLWYFVLGEVHAQCLDTPEQRLHESHSTIQFLRVCRLLPQMGELTLIVHTRKFRVRRLLPRWLLCITFQIFNALTPSP